MFSKKAKLERKKQKMQDQKLQKKDFNKLVKSDVSQSKREADQSRFLSDLQENILKDVDMTAEMN